MHSPLQDGTEDAIGTTRSFAWKQDCFGSSAFRTRIYYVGKHEPPPMTFFTSDIRPMPNQRA